MRLSQSLKTAGFKLGRLKTGTPARLAKNSIDFTQLTVQHGEDPPVPFSFMNERAEIQVTDPCTYLTVGSSRLSSDVYQSANPRHPKKQLPSINPYPRNRQRPTLLSLPRS
jgi:tRNA U34 5-carboxymethylaminomethyl modifying enzyme MnmG/GidA